MDEESVDLTPGVVWTDSQLAVVRDLTARAFKAEAAVQRVRELHTPLDRGLGPNCQGCATHVTFTPWPCKTIRALGGTP
jgi:hypothetical protein